jgi:hypothetical protein
MHAQRSSTPLPYCLPEGIETEEIANALHAFMEDNPTWQAIEAGGLLSITLMTKWPCLHS